MIYKGHEIEDKVYLPNYEQLCDFDDNVFDLGEEQLQNWIRRLNEKKTELEENNVDYKDLHVKVSVNSYFDNPNGPDVEACSLVSLTWLESETEDMRNARIFREKAYIDIIGKK